MRPKIRATVVCVRDARVLLVSKDNTRWALPGGRPGAQEVLADTAVRELLEETALKAKTLVFLSQFLGATTVHHVFRVTVGKSAQPRPGHEIQQCRWFAPDELAKMTISPTTLRIVADTLTAR